MLYVSGTGFLLVCYTVFMSPDDIRQEIELKVVELIKAKLTDGSLTEDRSRQISQTVLETLQPGMDFKALYKGIFKLDDTCTELSEVVLPYAKQYEKNVTQKAAETVRDYIRSGKYDAAIKLADQAIKQDIDIVWKGSGKPS